MALESGEGRKRAVLESPRLCGSGGVYRPSSTIRSCRRWSSVRLMGRRICRGRRFSGSAIDHCSSGVCRKAIACRMVLSLLPCRVDGSHLAIRIVCSGFCGGNNHLRRDGHCPTATSSRPIW